MDGDGDAHSIEVDRAYVATRDEMQVTYALEQKRDDLTQDVSCTHQTMNRQKTDMSKQRGIRIMCSPLR